MVKVTKIISKEPLHNVKCPICDTNTLHVCRELTIPHREIAKAYVECSACKYRKLMIKTKDKYIPHRFKYEIDHISIERDRVEELVKKEDVVYGDTSGNVVVKPKDEEIRQIAKELGISHYWNKSLEKLEREINERSTQA